MTTTLAIFALFTIVGSVEVACGVGSTPTSPCTTAANLIGTCSELPGSLNCVATTCTDDLGCTSTYLKGTCNSATPKRCVYAEKMCPTGAVDDTPCMDSGNIIGRCKNFAGTQKCQIENTCHGMSQSNPCAYGYLQGTCADATKCKYQPSTGCGDNDKVCKDVGNLLGVCKDDKCFLAEVCGAGKSAGDVCTVGTSRAGECLGPGGKCKYIETVNVKYTIEAEIARTVVYKLGLPAFHSALEKQFADADNTVKGCPAGVHDVADAGSNGTFSCSDVPGKPCTFTCSAHHAMKSPHTLKCEKTSTSEFDKGEWTGTLGVCAPVCTVLSGTEADGIGFKKSITNGDIFCPNLFTGTRCNVKCDDSFRVSQPTNYGCTSEGKAEVTTWGSVEGTCGPSVDVPVSTEILLRHGDDHAKIAAKNDTAFNQKFKSVVAAQTGVFPENIIITGITPVDPAGGLRRLDDRSVKVAYTVQVAKEDLEADLEDDGHLPVGGALRGIP